MAESNDASTPGGRDASASALTPGDRIGRYVISRVIGRGGFGITYDALDETLGRRVAIKECFPDGTARVDGNATGGAGFVELRTRFLQEARTMAALPSHPSLASVHDLFEDRSTAYIAMEFIPGPTALEMVESRPGGLAEDLVHGLMLQLADALALMHRFGHLHRDVKPSNVILRPDDLNPARSRAVLVDFGSARQFSALRSGHMTQLVTHGYAPLEQYGRSNRLDTAVDVYALCATAYHLLLGRSPTPAPDRAAGESLSDARSLRTEVSERMSQALARGMAMVPSERLADMNELRSALLGEPIRPVRRQGDTVAIRHPSSDVAETELTRRTEAADDVGRDQPKLVSWADPIDIPSGSRRHRVVGAAALVGLLGLAGVAMLLLRTRQHHRVAAPHSAPKTSVARTESSAAPAGTPTTTRLPQGSTSVPVATTTVAPPTASVAAASAETVATTSPSTPNSERAHAPWIGAWRGSVLAPGVELVGASGVLLTGDSVMVADYSGNRVVLDPGEPIPFARPADLTATSTGDVFVVETAKHVVRRLRGDVVVGTGKSGRGKDGIQAVTAALSDPSDAAAAENVLVVADRGNKRVVQVDLVTGEFRVLASGISNLSGIALSRSGRIVVSRLRSGSLLEVHTDGTASEIPVPTGAKPSGLSFDANGVLYLIDTARKKIVTLDDTGVTHDLDTDIDLRTPIDISVAGNKIAVLDGNRVVIFSRK